MNCSVTRAVQLFVLAASLSACSADAGKGGAVGQSEQAIVGGYLDSDDVAVVAVVQGAADGTLCTGTLIAPNLVLTARHCVAETLNEDPNLGIVCSKTQFGAAQPGEAFLIAPDTSHHYFGTGTVRVPEDAAFCGNDVALIVLGKSVPASVAQPLTPRIDDALTANESYSAVGYGLTSPGGQDFGARMRVDANNVECSGGACENGSKVIAGSEWLGSARTCPGDSGGPALDAHGKVIGVLSRGPDGCLSSVYSAVGFWKELLVSTALEAASDAGVEPPAWATGESSTPLGESCTAACRDGYLCLSSNGKMGNCVPACSAQAPSCPSSYACDTHLNACSNLNPVSSGGGDSGGCSIAPAHTGFGSWLGLGLTIGAALIASRRRRM